MRVIGYLMVYALLAFTVLFIGATSFYMIVCTGYGHPIGECYGGVFRIFIY